MSHADRARPAPDEHHPYYAPYVALPPDEDIRSVLEGQLAATVALLSPLGDAEAAYRYGPDKWSVKQVVGHLCDTERVMAYRALRIARGDATPLAGFDENLFAEAASSDARPLGELLDELAAVRAATVALFRGLPDAAWRRRGTANDHSVSVRALAWITAGHELHHRRILQERYLARPGSGTQ